MSKSENDTSPILTTKREEETIDRSKREKQQGLRSSKYSVVFAYDNDLLHIATTHLLVHFDQIYSIARYEERKNILFGYYHLNTNNDIAGISEAIVWKLEKMEDG
eukprot:TRINITY_DN24362_c0_g1_i1.p1 TRINITY_DN24362_c0_g1~~TRINITY_DN24362_c0_g1_i1.p1  ORF type:complete len:105 (-),score=3.01 TRINITY_DN24362_c0_g1_i1:51-365(-)